MKKKQFKKRNVDFKRREWKNEGEEKKKEEKKRGKQEDSDGGRRRDVPLGSFPLDEGWALSPQQYMSMCVFVCFVRDPPKSYDPGESVFVFLYANVFLFWGKVLVC